MLTHEPPSVQWLPAMPAAQRLCRWRRIVQPIIALITLFCLWSAGAVVSLAQAPVPAANPDLSAGCGLDVILILDESGSIADDAQAVRDGARAMLEALAGTRSRVAVIEFNSTARLPIGPAYIEVTAGPGGSISTGGIFDLYLTNNYNPDDSTNWEDALLKAHQLNSSQGIAPLIIFFTDGNPNTYIDANGSMVSGTEADALQEAIGAANLLKMQGSHLFVVGVAAVTEANLIQISGPDRQPESGKPYRETDYTLASFATLKTALRTNAFALCAPSLTVTKMVDQANGQGYLPAPGWRFTGTVELVEPGQAVDNFEWVEPVKGLAATVGQTQSGVTAANGALRWQWVPGTRLDTQPWRSQITFTEEQRPDYTFVQADCQRKTLNADGSGFSESSFVLDRLPATVLIGPVDVVTCTVRNAKTALNIQKTTNVASLPERGGPVLYAFTVTNPGAISVTLTSLLDSVFQNLHGQGNCVADGTVTLAPGQAYTCQMTKPIIGNAGLVHTNVVTATAVTRLGNAVRATDQVTVTLTDVPSALTVSYLADRTSVLEPGALVTFTVVVRNTSAVDTVTVDQVISEQFGDIRAGCLPKLPVVLLPGEAFTCTFTRFIGGAVGDITIDKVTASGVDDDGALVSDADQEEVMVSDIASSLRVSKQATPLRVPETGALVTFTVDIVNTSLVDRVTITEVLDLPGGDLAPVCRPALPATLAVGAQMQCVYTTLISGRAGSVYTNLVTAKGLDDEGLVVTDRDQTDVQIDDVLPNLAVTKSANPTSVLDTGGLVTFTVTVINRSLEPVTLTALTDSVFADLNGQGTCATPQNLAGNGSYTCTFSAMIADEDKLTHENVVRVVAADDEGNVAQATARAVVNLIQTQAAISATKQDELQVDTFERPEDKGKITPGDTLIYHIRIQNNGSRPATGVQVDDAPDPNSQLVAGSVQTSKGQVLTGNKQGDSQVSIRIGEVAIGEVVTISFEVIITPGTGSTLLRNQVFVRNIAPDAPGGVSVTPSDDPDTPAPNDATDTIVFIPPTGLPPKDEPLLQPKLRLFLPLIAER